MKLKKLILQVRAKLIQLCETQGILPWNFWEIAAKKTAYLLAVCLCRLRRQVFQAFGKQKEIFSENMRINGGVYSFCAKKAVRKRN